MLKVSFSHISGFYASFTAHVFGEKVSVMPNEKNSTLFRQCLENGVFLCRLAHFRYLIQISTGEKKFYPGVKLMINSIN